MHHYNYGSDYETQPKKKSNGDNLSVKMNKNASVCMTVKFGKGTSVNKMSQLKKKIHDEFSFKMHDPSEVRIFNNEGLELYEEDFEFMRDSEEIYASRGEEFDHSTYYSEYEITKTLGFGGFGKVVLGTHKITGEKVAIKSTKSDAIGMTKLKFSKTKFRVS
jgi:hypothetical protein